VQLGRLAHDAHAAAAAAGRRLRDEREAELLGLALRDDGHAGLARDRLGGELVAASSQGLGRGADPDEARRLDGLGEVGALGEEAVPGVDRLGAGLAGGPDVLLGVEIARDLDRLVGRAGVQGVAVVGRDDGDGADPELAAGAEDA
jgi:hypothetical protein